MRIRTLAGQDREGWGQLYAGYAAFYRVAQTEEMRARVWGWLQDPARGMVGLVAEAPGGRLVGLAHLRAFARPLSATTGGFLDDLFVEPAARGQGVARALIAAAAEEARGRGWSVLRWITAEDNRTARALYDQVATATPWVTYDLTR
jgi:GNAT superfamily N-acetyltransferase